MMFLSSSSYAYDRVFNRKNQNKTPQKKPKFMLPALVLSATVSCALVLLVFYLPTGLIFVLGLKNDLRAMQKIINSTFGYWFLSCVVTGSFTIHTPHAYVFLFLFTCNSYQLEFDESTFFCFVFLSIFIQIVCHVYLTIGQYTLYKSIKDPFQRPVGYAHPA